MPKTPITLGWLTGFEPVSHPSLSSISEGFGYEPVLPGALLGKVLPPFAPRKRCL